MPPCAYLRPASGRFSGSRCGLDCHPVGDLDQVRRHDAPAHPTSESGLPMIAAAVQAKTTAPHADPPFNTSTKPKSSPEPGGSLLYPSRWWGLPGGRDDETRDPGLAG